MAEPSFNGQIQNYNLFGESRELPDVVHCESIATRSKLYRWKLAPHRHTRLHQVLLVEKGGGHAELEGKTFALSARVVVNVPIGCVHAFKFHRGTRGSVVTLGTEVLDETLQDSEGVRSMLSAACVLGSTREIDQTIAGIATEHADRGLCRAHVLRSLSGLLIGLVARSISSAGLASLGTHSNPLLHRFETLVDARFLEHWSVSDYAKTLAVTPAHLSHVTRQATGLSAIRIIEGRVIREARRYLAYTGLTISEVGYALGFADPAYFTRVFTRSTGMSPSSFRSRLDRASSAESPA